MNDAATSLDRLHDIVAPAPVPFWPPAPGWYFVIGAVVCVLAYASYRSWRRWRANAYRREALRELADAGRATEIAELLRRVALVVAPRRIVAAQTGPDWPEWLSARCPEPMPPSVRRQLSTGLYREFPAESDVAALKAYVAAWIAHHPATKTPDAVASTVPKD